MQNPNRQLVSLVSVFVLYATSGCIYGSLATDSGVSQLGRWSVEGVQDVHIGENVTYSFVLRQAFSEGTLSAYGIADYCSAIILGDRVEAEANVHGGFEFSHTLSSAETGMTVPVSAHAYATRGNRDHMKIRGQWRRSESPIDEPDEAVAKASVKLRVYQSVVDYTFTEPEVKLDWTSARLAIIKADASVSTVLARTPHRPGFTRNGPDSSGKSRIQYYPTADQVDKRGKTRATLYVLDVHGHEHAYQFSFDTP